MKKIITFFLVLTILMLVFPATGYASQDIGAPVTSGSSTIFARVPLGGTHKLLDTSKAALLYELNSDTLVYSWNADERIDPTGMVKLMTVLVALEEGNLEDQVTVTRKALDSVAIGAVSAELKRGEILSLYDLLQCVMVASANDAAAVIAEHVGGTQKAFVEKMNRKAQELGCSGTQFVNPHGLSQEGQYSTARDLAIITEAALENALFAEMFSAKTYTVPATNVSDARVLHTTNHMMSSDTIKNYVDDRVTGGKPAAATLTDRSMICTAEVGGTRYLCVVMSAEAQVSEDKFSVITFGSFEETKALLDYGFHNFEVRQVVDQSQAFAQYGVLDGENDVVVRPERDVYTVLPKDLKLEQLHFTDYMDADRLTAPLQQGTAVGSLQISYGSVVLGSCDLVAMYSVAQKGTTILPGEYLEVVPEGSTGFLRILKWILLGAGALVVLAFAVVLGIRLSRSARIRRLHKRRRRERRRSR